MEIGIQKRQNIRFKKEATFLKTTKDMTEAQLQRSCEELKRSIHATRKETNATENRVGILKEKRSQCVTDLDKIQRLLNDTQNSKHDIESKTEQVTLIFCTLYNHLDIRHAMRSSWHSQGRSLTRNWPGSLKMS